MVCKSSDEARQVFAECFTALAKIAFHYALKHANNFSVLPFRSRAETN